MVVETYEVEEVKQATVEQCEEALRLVQDLGLAGQAKLYEQQAGAPEAKPFPYRKMTAQEMWVYGRILPVKTNLTNYEDQAIPLRVLQVAAHVSKLIEGRYDCILQVWHPQNADYKDPLLVMRDGPEYGKNSHYILARWGEELEEFGVLATKAKAIFRADSLAQLNKEIGELQNYVNNIDSEVEARFQKGQSGTIGAYWS